MLFYFGLSITQEWPRIYHHITSFLFVFFTVYSFMAEVAKVVASYPCLGIKPWQLQKSKFIWPKLIAVVMHSQALAHLPPFYKPISQVYGMAGNFHKQSFVNPPQAFFFLICSRLFSSHYFPEFQPTVPFHLLKFCSLVVQTKLSAIWISIQHSFVCLCHTRSTYNYIHTLKWWTAVLGFLAPWIDKGCIKV